MKKIITLLSVLSTLLVISCKKESKSNSEQKTEAETSSKTDTKVTHKETKKIAPKLEQLKEAIGDLDNDGIDERVVVYNSSRSNENGIEREIHFFKKEGTSWIPWKKTNEGILESKMGGMFGDPFKEITIKNGILEIQHLGGSRYKWETSNKYRFQNENFELIGYTQKNAALCEFSYLIDYNLSTGNALLEKNKDKCNGQGDSTGKKTLLSKKVKYNTTPLPNLHDGKSTDIITPLLKAAGEPNFLG